LAATYMAMASVLQMLFFPESITSTPERIFTKL